MTIKEFDSLPENERRVIIAKDIIQTIEKEIFAARSGYFNTILTSSYLEESDTDSKDLKQMVEEGRIKCAGCARGAIFLGIILKRDKLTVKQSYLSDFGYIQRDNFLSATEYISQDFSPFEQAKIESAYECSDYYHNTPTDEEMEIIEQCYRWGNRISAQIAVENDLEEDDYDVKKFLLIEIMQNIIDNKGVFTP